MHDGRGVKSPENGIWNGTQESSYAKVETSGETVNETIHQNKKSSKKSSKKSAEGVLAALEGNPLLTLAGIAEATGLSVAGVRKVLDKLRADNRIRRIGPDKGGLLGGCGVAKWHVRGASANRTTGLLSHARRGDAEERVGRGALRRDRLSDVGCRLSCGRARVPTRRMGTDATKRVPPDPPCSPWYLLARFADASVRSIVPKLGLKPVC